MPWADSRDGTRRLNERFNELRRVFGGKCQECGCADYHRLEFAHTAPTNLRGKGRGKWKRYYDVKRNPLHYILLCEDCHREYDHGRK